MLPGYQPKSGSNSNLYPRYENLFPRHNYAWILVKGLIRVLIYILAPDEIDEAEDVAPLYDYLEENHDHANKDKYDKSANLFERSEPGTRC